MAEHEPCIGATDDWYTSRDIFDALGLIFDLDPCSPGPAHWVPARKIYTKEDDGLVQPWSGTVFMNPPFGRRNGHVPWLRKFLAHGGRTRRRSARHGHGSEQGAGAVRARLLRADRLGLQRLFEFLNLNRNLVLAARVS